MGFGVFLNAVRAKRARKFRFNSYTRFGPKSGDWHLFSLPQAPEDGNTSSASSLATPTPKNEQKTSETSIETVEGPRDLNTSLAGVELVRKTAYFAKISNDGVSHTSEVVSNKGLITNKKKSVAGFPRASPTTIRPLVSFILLRGSQRRGVWRRHSECGAQIWVLAGCISGGNFRRTFRTIGPYGFPQEKVWTNDWSI